MNRYAASATANLVPSRPARLRPAAGAVAALLLVVTLCAGVAGASEHTFPSNCLPPANGQYVGQFHAAFAAGLIDLRNPIHQQFTACDPPPANIGDVTFHSFGSLTQFELSTDGGATYQPMTAPAQVTVRVAKSTDTGGLATYQTEMLQLDIAGGTLPPGDMVRESPTLASTGQTTIRDMGNGSFRIDSFFDIFTELSLDGGQTWMPSSSPPGHMQLDIVNATPARRSTWGSIKAFYR